MLRGIRWQLIALLIAILAFTASVVYRRGREPAPQPALTAESKPAATGTSAPTDAPFIIASATESAVGLGAATQPDTFREGLVGGLQRLNPLFAHLNPPDRDITSLIFEGLFATNNYGEPVPLLATESIVSSDGLEYVLRLRADLLWQDGVAFSADDVVYTMSLLGEDAYADYSPAAAFWRAVETQKLSDRLVRFRLAQPYGSFLHLLTVGILPEHALRGASVTALAAHPFNLSPIGTGAYQLSSLGAAPDGSINEIHLDLAPVFRQRSEAQSGYGIKRLQFKLYPDSQSALDAWRANKIDAFADVTFGFELAALPSSQLYTQVDSALGVLIFNWGDERFSDRRLRQSLALSLDLPGLIAARFGTAATHADSPYIPGSSYYRPDSFWATYDPERAESLLEATEADLPADEPGAGDAAATETGADFTLLVQDSAQLLGLAADMTDGWRRLGLEVEVEAAASDELLERLAAGRFDLAIVTQRIGGDPDLFRFWHPAQYEIGFNFGAADDTGVAETLELARAEIYAVRRAELYHEFQTHFSEAALAIPLWYPVYTYALRDAFSGIGLGYLVTEADRFRGLRHWQPATIVG